MDTDADLGGYRLGRLIGAGGQARVWTATAPDGSTVALKILQAPVAPALAAARREIAGAVATDHPHLLRPREVVSDGSRVALVSPLAEGGSLESLVRRCGPLTPAQTLTVLLPLAEALATAHEREVVHGDLSPANVVLDAIGRPLLTDLGSARIAAEHGLPTAVTPGWVAPEIARGADADAAADVFSLGAIGLYCLTGAPAWQADDLRDVVVQATVGRWPDPGDRPDAPRLVAALRSALRERADRRPGAAALRVELGRCGTPAPLPDPGPVALEPLDGTPGTTSGRHAARPTRRVLTQRRPRERAEDEVPLIARRERNPFTRIRVLRGSTTGGSGAAAADRLPAGRARPTGETSGSRRSRGRVAAAVLAAAVLGAAAVQGGLWWADATATRPVSPPVATVPSGTVPPGTVPPGTVPSEVPPRTAAPVPATPLPTPTPTPPPTPTSTTPPAPSPSTPRSSPAVPPPAADWSAVVRELDARRARALVERDPAALDAVYTGRARAAAADRATIARLQQRGWRLTGARHEILAAARCPDCGPPPAGSGRGAVVLVVTDRLPAYPVVGADGVTAGRTAARDAARSVVVVVPTAAGWRIAAVSAARAGQG